MDSRIPSSDIRYLHLTCSLVCLMGAAAGLGAALLWDHASSPGGVLAWAALLLALHSSGRLIRSLARWRGLVLVAAGLVMLRLGFWIVMSPTVADLPGCAAFSAFLSAGLLLAVGLTVALLKSQSGETAARNDPVVAALGVLGGLLGVLAGVVTLVGHGPIFGGPALVLALAGIFGGLMAEGNRVLAYALLIVPGVLGFAFAWLHWAPAGVLLVAAGLVETGPELRARLGRAG